MNMFRRHQAGFSLIELMVAMAIALFLIGGVLTMLGNTRSTYETQSRLAQLQDDQRLAMTAITDVVQAAGYYPDPINMTNVSEFKARTYSVAGQTLKFAADGQYITGATNPLKDGSGNLAGDSFAVVYDTAGKTGTTPNYVIDCTGQLSTAPLATSTTNTFAIDANDNLLCSVNEQTPVRLVSGITSLKIWYGLKTNLAVDDNQVDTYVPTSDMQDADWPHVISLRVDLTFKNPLYGEPGQTSKTIDFTRVVMVMNKAGAQT
jgi:type IV pilus assembly protein PilW